MVHTLEHGDSKAGRRRVRLQLDGPPAPHRHAGDGGRVRALGFARSAAGEYTFSIFAVVAIALISSWIAAAVFAPLLGVWILRSRRRA